MRPIEPEGQIPPDDDPGFEVDTAFRRLAQATHAPDDFYHQVMTRAAALPRPRRQGTTAAWQSMVPRLPHAATVALVSVLLLCIAGLGYLYHRVEQLQAVVEQEQVRQQHATLQSNAAQRTTETRPLHKRGEWSDVTLEVETPNTPSTDHAQVEPEQQPASGVKSIFEQALAALRRAFDALWDQVTGLTEPQSSPSP